MLIQSYIPPRFRFSLKSATGDYYSVAPNGNVMLGSAPESVQEPDGWKETEIKWVRSKSYWGLLTTLTTSYQFVGDGAKILRHIYFTQGIEGKCRLVVEKRRKTDFTYEQFYEGEVNFSTIQDEDDHVAVNIEQGGLTSLFRANENTPYELAIVGDNVRMDGVQLRNKSIMQVSGSQDASIYMPSHTNIRNESDMAPSTRNQVDRVWDPERLTKNHPFFVAATNTEVTIEFDIRLRLELGHTGTMPDSNLYTLVVGRYNPVTQAVTYQTIFAASGLTLLNTTTTTTVSLSWNLLAGETLAFFGAMRKSNGDFVDGNNGGGNSAADLQQILYGTTFKISYYTRLPESACQGMRYYEVVNGLMSALSDATATVSAPFLTSPATISAYNRPYHTRLTSADNIRNLPFSKLKIRFSDLFKDMHGRWLLGLGISGNAVTIAPLADFFQNIPVGHLGNVTEFAAEPASDLFFSDYKLGMKTVNADQLNGRFEVTSEQTWKVPIQRTDKTRDGKSPFIGGMYSIEKIRSDIGRETTNTEPDGDIVVLETEASPSSGKYNLYRPATPVLTGLATPIMASAYNLTLRPRLDLERNKPLLAAICHNTDILKLISFQTAEREGRLSMNGVDDFASIPVYELGAMPFLPVRFRFMATVPENLYQILFTNPYGYFTFDYKEVRYKGFVDEISQNTGDDSAVQCSLIAHPQTDLTTLIR